MDNAQRVSNCNLCGGMIVKIPRGFADVMWESFKPYLERAMADQPLEVATLADLERDVRCGRLTLLQISDGQGTRAICGITVRPHRDGTRVLHIAYLSGDSHEMWIDELHEYLWWFAREERCKWISLTGRPGWRKVIQKFNDNPRVVAVHLIAEV